MKTEINGNLFRCGVDANYYNSQKFSLGCKFATLGYSIAIATNLVNGSCSLENIAQASLFLLGSLASAGMIDEANNYLGGIYNE